MKNMDPILELSYLTAENARRYRRIMRVFYDAYQKVRFQLDKEAVFEAVQGYDDFEDYTMEQLKQDLAALVKWQNLVPIQDATRVQTIEDYRNKQFRYSMSEYAVEIERMTLRLESLSVESSSLSASLFENIEGNLEQIGKMEGMPPDKVNAAWRELHENFKRLNQNYQDYLREFYSSRSGKVLKSIDFVIHKDHFITYLKDFIRELQIHSDRIRRILSRFGEKEEAWLLEAVIASELAIPHPLAEVQADREAVIRENVVGKWEVLKGWFVPGVDGRCESIRVLEITNDIIRKIIQNAALIMQLQNFGISRKADYRQFLRDFVNCEDMNAAHCLAAHVFGIQNIKHLKVNASRQTESINSSVYEEAASVYQIKPRTRLYHERLSKAGFKSKTAEKEQVRAAYLKRVEAERRQAERYIVGGRLRLTEIGECIPATLRMTLLRWISAANTTNTKRGRTEYGAAYRLLQEPGDCLLHCEDGDLRLPAFVLEFEEG